jgi:hypothetical protein
VKDKLRREVLDGQWSDLQPHAERSALFILEPGIDIVDVGVAIVADDITKIESLLNEGILTRPTPNQLKSWDLIPEKPFRILIIAPYVLIQILPH